MRFTNFLKICIFGKDRELPLERRILILLTFYGVILASAGNVVNIMLGFDLKLILGTFFALLTILLFYGYARTSPTYAKLSVPFFMLSILFFTLNWFLNGGFEGNSVNLMMIYFIGIYVTMPKKFRLLVFLCYLIDLITLFLIQYKYPHLITPYDNQNQRFADMLFGNILYYIFAYFVIDIISRSYTKENQKVHSINQELIHAKEKAEESDRLKSAFLANMSHEIRTPLNGILGFTTLLSRDNVTKEQKEKYSKIIAASADGLLQIINDLLDISKIESGQLEIINNPCEINVLIAELSALYSLKQNGRKTPVTFLPVPYREEISIMTDESRLRQIFINLLDNALKFTNQGTIEFGVMSYSSKQINFYVKDSGIGIPQNMQALIFDRFRQAEPQNSNHRGNGLGLSIVKQLLDLMGGDIKVDSIPDIGSTFIFFLPADAPMQK